MTTGLAPNCFPILYPEADVNQFGRDRLLKQWPVLTASSWNNMWAKTDTYSENSPVFLYPCTTGGGLFDYLAPLAYLNYTLQAFQRVSTPEALSANIGKCVAAEKLLKSNGSWSFLECSENNYLTTVDMLLEGPDEADPLPERYGVSERNEALQAW